MQEHKEEDALLVEEEEVQVPIAPKPSAASREVALIVKNPLLMPLWLACFFEKRLTKSAIVGANLTAAVEKMREMSGRISFQNLVPLLVGVSRLLQRKYTYIHSEA